MLRAILIAVILISFAESSRPNQVVYPPLTRETLVGTWEGVVGIGTDPVVFHIVIAARDMIL